MPPRNGSRIQVRRRTNTEGISDNQQVTRNGVKERKKERKNRLVATKQNNDKDERTEQENTK
jgi:hypothetical protein